MANTGEEWVLNRMNCGWLKVDVGTLEVRSWHPGRKRWKVVKPDQHHLSGRWRFRFGPKRCTVYRNRLIFIWVNRAIPVECVDHKDLNRLNDRPENLQGMSRQESSRQGYDVQMAKNLEEWGRWLDFMAVFDPPGVA